MRLLFCYLDEKVYTDHNGNMFSSGNFTKDVWNRYLSLADELSVVMTQNTQKIDMINKEKSLHKIDTSKFSIHLVPHNKDSISHYLSIKIRKKRMRIIEKQIQSSDAVIIRAPNTNLVNLCKKYHKPYAVEVVGCTWDGLWNHSLKGKIVALPYFIDSKISIINAPYVLYVTNAFLQKRYPTKGKSIGCSDVLLKMQDNSVLGIRLEKIKNNNGRIILGTAAALNVKYKGQRFVIQAMAKLKKQGITNFEYQVIGGGDASLLIKAAEKYGVSDQFKVIGQLNHDKVFEWLESIDIYIQPSVTEGLPRAVIEAMSFALPCMGTDVGGIPELIDRSMLFGRKNIKEIADLLKSIDKEKMLALAEQNFNKSKEYDKDALDKKRHDFYMDFIESR